MRVLFLLTTLLIGIQSISQEIITKEDVKFLKNELPRNLIIKPDYIEIEGVYKHAALMKVKGTANDLDKKLKDVNSQFDDVNARLSSYDELKKEEIKKGIDDAIAKAKSENNVDEILKLERQKLDDERKIIANDRDDLEEVQLGIATDKLKTIADRMSEYATKDGKPAFNRLVKSQNVVIFEYFNYELFHKIQSFLVTIERKSTA